LQIKNSERGRKEKARVSGSNARYKLRDRIVLNADKKLISIKNGQRGSSQFSQRDTIKKKINFYHSHQTFQKIIHAFCDAASYGLILLKKEPVKCPQKI